MPGVSSRALHLWRSRGMMVAVGALMAGCSQGPRIPAGDVSQKITALADCVMRSQRTVDAAMSTGASAGEMGPTNTALVDARGRWKRRASRSWPASCRTPVRA